MVSDVMLKSIYGCPEVELAQKRNRIENAEKNCERLFGTAKDIRVYSAPGRTEIGGNHTDHQGGCVLAAAVDMDALAVVGKRDDGIINIVSDGYESFSVDTADLGKKADDCFSAKLVRGTAEHIAALGIRLGGFDAYICSDVPGGSGLSSSACFEVLLGTVINDMYCGGSLDAMDIARAGRYAENEHAGKPSGLLDQTASAVGGLVSLDFSKTEPLREKLTFDFEAHGYTLCVVDTGAGHADLNEEYAAIPADMKKAAGCFGKDILSEVSESEFFSSLPKIKECVGSRAVMRAIHYFGETKRAVEQARALKNDDMTTFLSLVNASGRSSENCLQNIYPLSDGQERSLALALELTKRFLDGDGACRVHGGGFAGTIQAYIPNGRMNEYIRYIEKTFLPGCCRKLRIRPVGGLRIK